MSTKGLKEIYDLVSKKGINATHGEGDTVLISAACEGYTEIAKALIKAGADVDKLDEYGNTALFLAIRGGHTEIAKALIKAGADVDELNTNGTTPLMKAVYDGNIAVVKALVAAGADLDKQEEKHGETALIIAAKDDHAEIVKVLIKAGADVDKQDCSGWRVRGYLSMEAIVEQALFERSKGKGYSLEGSIIKKIKACNNNKDPGLSP